MKKYLYVILFLFLIFTKQLKSDDFTKYHKKLHKYYDYLTNITSDKLDLIKKLNKQIGSKEEEAKARQKVDKWFSSYKNTVNNYYKEHKKIEDNIYKYFYKSNVNPNKGYTLHYLYSILSTCFEILFNTSIYYEDYLPQLEDLQYYLDEYYYYYGTVKSKKNPY